MQISERWQHIFLDVAKSAQKASKDPSTKVGCAVYRGKELLCMGFNGLPEAIPDDPTKLADREWKNKHTIHAEINALNRYKGSLQGCGIVTTFLPCSDCAQSIIDRGIKTVYYIKASPEAEQRWAESFKASKQKFEKAGVSVFEIKQV